jgi:hypothetical protein
VAKLKKVILLLTLAVAFLLGSVSTFAVMEWTQRVYNVAKVKVVGVGIYKDLNFTVSVTQIDWGMIEPGESKNFSAYIVNESNVPMTLMIRTENWTPLNASSFMTLSWDYDGTIIDVDGSVPVTLTLQVAQAVSGIETFSFDIVIVGAG